MPNVDVEDHAAEMQSERVRRNSRRQTQAMRAHANSGGKSRARSQWKLTSAGFPAQWPRAFPDGRGTSGSPTQERNFHGTQLAVLARREAVPPHPSIHHNEYVVARTVSQGHKKAMPNRVQDMHMSVHRPESPSTHTHAHMHTCKSTHIGTQTPS